MNKNPLNWRVAEQQLKQELVSADNRWHISRTQNSELPAAFFLTNYDLLLTPHGSGQDYEQCFSSFITNCDEFTRKVLLIREEAVAHLQTLKQKALEENSNGHRAD